MFNIYVINYSSLKLTNKNELLSLRKSTFKDRLNWDVDCENGMEFDKFDNQNANYILGIMDKKIICGTRLIEMKNTNMLMDTFSCFFDNIVIPKGNYIESTRFFVDKERAQGLLGRHFPVTKVLFLSLINFARKHNYDGIIAVASQGMMRIIKRSGWNITILAVGNSEKNEPVYLVLGHVDKESQKLLRTTITSQETYPGNSSLYNWPLQK